MDCFDIEIQREFSLSIGAIQVAASIDVVGSWWIDTNNFFRRQKSVVVFEFEQCVIMLPAKVSQAHDAEPVKMMAQLKIRVVFDNKADRRRNFFIDLSDN